MGSNQFKNRLSLTELKIPKYNLELQNETWKVRSTPHHFTTQRLHELQLQEAASKMTPQRSCLLEFTPRVSPFSKCGQELLICL